MGLPDRGGLEMHAPPRGGVVATRRGVATGVLRPGGEPRAQNANDRQNQWTVHEHEVDYGGTLPPTIDCDSQMSTRDDRSGPWSWHGRDSPRFLDPPRARRAPHQSKRSASGTAVLDRKSTRLNYSHLGISYAVFCL